MSEQLLGRGPERAQLDAQVAAARSGRGSLVLLAGDAGVGKTTLARLVLDGSGLDVLEGIGVEQAGSGYGPVVAALRSYLRSGRASCRSRARWRGTWRCCSPSSARPPRAATAPPGRTGGWGGAPPPSTRTGA